MRGVWAVVGLLAIGACGADVPPRGPRAQPSRAVPAPDAVVARGGYEIRPCGTAPPRGDAALFTARRVAGKPGARGYERTRVLDAGPLDLRDGRFWQGGFETTPVPDGQELPVPPGTPHVALLVAEAGPGFATDVVAAGVRLAPGRVVRWREEPRLRGGTDAATIGLGGVESLTALAVHRDFEDAIDDISAHAWDTPCTRLVVTGDPAAPPGVAAAIGAVTGWDGGWVGAVGHDARDRPVALMLSATRLPWSLLGLPGAPPPEALRDEATAAP